MDFLLDDNLRQFRDAVARRTDDRLAPRAEQLDHDDVFSRDSFFPMAGGGTGDIVRLVVARQIGLDMRPARGAA